MTRISGRYWLRILILLSIINRVVNLSIQDAGQPRNKVASLPSTTKNPTTTGDFLIGGSRKRRRKKIQTARRPPVPLVDSALLRFLALQKEGKTTNTTATVNLTQNILQSMDQTKANITKAPEASEIPETYSNDIVSSTSSSNSNSATSSWLGQFNSNRVSLKLVKLGVTRDRAEEAGEVVQRHVLARIARRRVRNFLKERDALWINGSEQSSKERKIIDNKSSSSSTEWEEKTPSTFLTRYDLDDVLELLSDIGLTGNDIAAIFSHTPSVALMMPRRPFKIRNENAAEMNVKDLEEQESETIVDTNDDTESNLESNGETLEETTTRAFGHILCDLLNLRKNDARRILRSCPGLLTMRGSRSAEQVVTLLSKLGVSTKSIARDKASLPVLLSRSPSAMFRLVAFLSSDDVRMPMKNIGPLLRRAECVPLLDVVAPVPRVDATRKKVTPTIKGGGKSEVDPSSAALRQNSELRRKQINEVYRNMSSTARALRYEIGTQDMGLVIATYPSVLLLDAKEQILPTASYLIKDLGIWEDDLPKVLQLFPTLLGVDIEQMELVASYLISLEVDENALGGIFRAFPKLLTLDVYKEMVPVVAFLRQIGITNVGRFVTRLPPILGYSVKDELIPKWEYLSELGLYNSYELSRFPAYFSYPLNRIKLRFEYLRDVKRIPVQLLELDTVLRYGDRDFVTKVAKDIDDGQTFKKFAEKQRGNMPKKNRNKKKAKRKSSNLSIARSKRNENR